MMKLWIYENHMCELRSEELYEGGSPQLYTQFLQSRKESVRAVQAWFFSKLSATAKIAYITAMIFLHIILHSAVHIYDFQISEAYNPEASNFPLCVKNHAWVF